MVGVFLPLSERENSSFGLEFVKGLERRRTRHLRDTKADLAAAAETGEREHHRQHKTDSLPAQMRCLTAPLALLGCCGCLLLAGARGQDEVQGEDAQEVTALAQGGQSGTDNDV